MREWSAYLLGREAPKKPGATAPVPARAPLRLVVPMAA